MTMIRRLFALCLGLALWAAPCLALDIKQGDTTIRVGVLMVASSDHTSPLTGATLTVTRSKNGSAFSALSGTVAEVANGWYSVTLAAGDVDTIGDLVFHATAASGDPSDRLVTIVAYDPKDATALGLSRVDAAVSTRLASASFVPPTNWSQMAISGAGAVTAGTVGDKTGYSLTQGFPANFAAMAIAGGGAVTAGTVSDKSGYSLSATPPTAAQVAAAILVTPGNLLATDSSGRVTTTSLIVRGTVVAGSTSSSVTVSGLPTNASYAGQHCYRFATGEGRVIGSDTVSGSNHIFTLSGTGTAAAFGSAPSASESIGIVL